MRKYLDRKPLIKKFIKFGTVGTVCVVIDFTLVFLLLERLSINKYISNIISTSVTVVVNYMLNKIWTFRSKEPWKREFLRFVGIGTIGLCLNNLIVWFGDDYTNHLMQYLCSLHWQAGTILFNVCQSVSIWSFYLIKVVAIFVVMFWNFYINHRFNFQISKVE